MLISNLKYQKKNQHLRKDYVLIFNLNNRSIHLKVKANNTISSEEHKIVMSYVCKTKITHA